jgi:hypothetical protein
MQGMTERVAFGAFDGLNREVLNARKMERLNRQAASFRLHAAAPGDRPSGRRAFGKARRMTAIAVYVACLLALRLASDHVIRHADRYPRLETLRRYLADED